MFSSESEKCVYLQTSYAVLIALPKPAPFIPTGFPREPACSCSRHSRQVTHSLRRLFVCAVMYHQFSHCKACLCSPHDSECVEPPLTQKSSLPNISFIEGLLLTSLWLLPRCSFFRPKLFYHSCLLLHPTLITEKRPLFSPFKRSKLKFCTYLPSLSPKQKEENNCINLPKGRNSEQGLIQLCIPEALCTVTCKQ